VTRRLVDNPPWVNSLLEDNWDELLSVVKQPLMPFAVVERPSPRGRPSRVTVSPGAELGCGHYGCVMATRTPGVVCKVTSDRSEAEFVEAAWKVFGRDYADGWPKGLVRYYKIVGLTATTGIQDPYWLLWRDEVDHIGNPPGDSTAATLNLLKFYAEQVRASLAETDEDLAEAVSLWRRGAVDADVDNLIRADRTMTRLRALASLGLPAPRRLAVCLEMASRTIDALTDIPSVQSALRELLEHDMLLADVHRDNVGRGPKGWVITDPGHFVFLGSRRVARGTL
jgi:hypothetical protein